MRFITVKRAPLPFFIAVILFFSVFSAAADFNTSLDTVLSQESLTYGGASWLLLTGTGGIGEDASFAEAAKTMSEAVAGTGLSENDEVTLGMFSHLAVQTYGINSGLLYRFFPGPRYALRELRFRRIVQGRAFSRMSLSGEDALRIVNRILEKEEEAYAEK